MKIGIDRIGIYTPPFCVDAVALGARQGRDRAYLERDVLVGQRAVLPTFEDPVTLAVNAARLVVTEQNRGRIGLLLVGTESAFDLSKALSTWVHRHLRLPASCRSLEVKFACYGATGALQLAAAWVATHPGKLALVVSADATAPEAGPFDFVGGACAAALIVGADPATLMIDPTRQATWTDEVADTFRPTPAIERGDNRTSLYAYLDALDGALDHWERDVGPFTPSPRQIYHAPFPGMTVQAHRALMARIAGMDAEEARADWAVRVAPGITLARQLGTAYGASTFLGLASVLRAGPADRIGVFAYGSGCQGELWEGTVGPAPRVDVDGLADRRPLDLPEYDDVAAHRLAAVNVPDFDPRPPAHYGGRLYLATVADWRRTYRE